MLFFLLRDGGRLQAELRPVSPFSDQQERQIFDHLESTIKGALQAVIVVPVVQGILAGIGFMLFGVPSPFVWGTAVILAATVPIVGSPLGWLPGGRLPLLPRRDRQPAWASSLYCIVVVSGSDNVVKPMLLRGTANIHPLLGFPLDPGRRAGVRRLRLPDRPRGPLARALGDPDLPARRAPGGVASTPEAAHVPSARAIRRGLSRLARLAGRRARVIPSRLLPPPSTPPATADPKAGQSGTRHGALREAAPLLGLGMTLAVTVLAGLGAGYWLDGRLGTRPWLLLAGAMPRGGRGARTTSSRPYRGSSKGESDPKP